MSGALYMSTFVFSFFVSCTIYVVSVLFVFFLFSWASPLVSLCYIKACHDIMKISTFAVLHIQSQMFVPGMIASVFLPQEIDVTLRFWWKHFENLVTFILGWFFGEVFFPGKGYNYNMWFEIVARGFKNCLNLNVLVYMCGTAFCQLSVIY